MYIVLLEIEIERGNKMIKIITKDSDNGKFKSDTDIRGSGSELIRDFYVLHDAINRDTRLKLIYDIAIGKWESRHENK